jgi:hypothetical protein
MLDVRSDPPRPGVIELLRDVRSDPPRRYELGVIYAYISSIMSECAI